MSVFGGLGCLYDNFSNCEESSNLYPSIGAGVIYTLKKEAGILIRGEIAKGKGDEYVGYLTMGHPF